MNHEKRPVEFGAVFLGEAEAPEIWGARGPYYWVPDWRREDFI